MFCHLGRILSSKNPQYLRVQRLILQHNIYEKAYTQLEPQLRVRLAVQTLLHETYKRGSK